MISNEVKPKDPLIKGSPSKIIGGYVANGKLWYYNKSGGHWTEVAGAPANVRDVTQGYYILCVDGNNTAVYKMNGNNFTLVENKTQYTFIQGLYGNYAGAMKPGTDDYAILRLDASIDSAAAISSPLVAVSENYLATAHDGIVGSDGKLTVSGSKGLNIAGILGNYVVTGDGKILEISGNSINTIINSGPRFTGAMASWSHGGKNLLLLGIKSSSYELGYRELDLSNRSLNIPGDLKPDSSVSDRDKYISTLGKHAVTAFYVTTETGGSDGLPLIFASTQKAGLWSYRNNEWNAEE
jgi:hypothetical protein